MLEIHGERRSRLDSPFWQILTAELVRHNVRMGTNIVEYWRSVAKINITTLLTVTGGADTPLKRRRKFTVIQGGR
jgi:hypothetical protein